MTKTVLCFMIKSAAGKFRDVVSLTPVVTLSSKLLKETFDLVLETLEEAGFHVISLITFLPTGNFTLKNFALVISGPLLSRIQDSDGIASCVGQSILSQLDRFLKQKNPYV